MKSIMQEGSSIFKAIEEAWAKAGKPNDFSVKILEDAQKNFLGFTTKTAKIAIYIGDKYGMSGKFDMGSSSTSPKLHRFQAEEQKSKIPLNKKTIETNKGENISHRELKDREEPWSEEMLKYTKEWLEFVLQKTCKQEIKFQIEVQNFYLKIIFSQNLFDAVDKERKFFAGIALILIETLRRHFKSGLRKHKIILTHQQS